MVTGFKFLSSNVDGSGFTDGVNAVVDIGQLAGAWNLEAEFKGRPTAQNGLPA